MDKLVDDISNDMRKEFSDLYLKGDHETFQLALVKLRQIGCTQMQCLKVVMTELEIDLREADILVINSEAWAAEKARNFRFREEFEKFLKAR